VYAVLTGLALSLCNISPGFHPGLFYRVPTALDGHPRLKPAVGCFCCVRRGIAPTKTAFRRPRIEPFPGMNPLKRQRSATRLTRGPYRPKRSGAPQGRSRIARRGIAATRLSGPESTPGLACAGPPPPAGGQIHRNPLYSFCVFMSPAGGGGTPTGVPGVDSRFRVHEIRSLIGLISAREKCQSQTVKGSNA